MNIFDMARRADGNLELRAELVGEARPARSTWLARVLGPAKTRIAPTKRRIGNRQYRGFEMTGGSSFRLKTPFSWYPFRALPFYTGWEIGSLRSGRRSKLVLRIALVDHDTNQDVVAESYPIGQHLRPIALPQLFGWNHPRTRLDMQVEILGDSGHCAFFAVHPVLEREEILRLCRGRGVELGPGPKPQILPSDGVDVTYVELASPEQWENLYNEKGNWNIDASLWTRYITGSAHPLPVEDDSMDFIFASHVFEHLANPVGHLGHWRAKLRKGGLIAAIVPDLAGCKDYVFTPSSLVELVEEWRDGRMVPQLSHFERWAAVRAPGRDAKEFMHMQRSIHAHFYSHANIQQLLELAIQQLGFSRYDLRYVPNHKDFYFVLWN